MSNCEGSEYIEKLYKNIEYEKLTEAEKRQIAEERGYKIISIKDVGDMKKHRSFLHWKLRFQM